MSGAFTRVNSFRFCNIQSARIPGEFLRLFCVDVCKRGARVRVNTLILQSLVHIGEKIRLTCRGEAGKLFLRRGSR